MILIICGHLSKCDQIKTIEPQSEFLIMVLKIIFLISYLKNLEKPVLEVKKVENLLGKLNLLNPIG